MEWISVKDGYPKEDGTYLCYYKNDFRGMVVDAFSWWTSRSSYLLTTPDEAWHSTTYWMPLPDPPAMD